MKTLAECRTYFEGVYTNWLAYQDDDSLKTLENLKETLDFIYPDFKHVVNVWINDASKEYYNSLKK